MNFKKLQEHLKDLNLDSNEIIKVYNEIYNYSEDEQIDIMRRICFNQNTPSLLLENYYLKNRGIINKENKNLYYRMVGNQNTPLTVLKSIFGQGSGGLFPKDHYDYITEENGEYIGFLTQGLLEGEMQHEEMLNYVIESYISIFLTAIRISDDDENTDNIKMLKDLVNKIIFSKACGEKTINKLLSFNNDYINKELKNI